jgi:tail-anchored protein insertion receptor
MFYLPQGWVPYPVEWILSFPKAPLGGISVNVWAIACASVIALVSEGVRAGLTLREGKVIAGTNRGARVQTGTSSGGNGSAGANGGGNGGSATATGREL